MSYQSKIHVIQLLEALRKIEKIAKTAKNMGAFDLIHETAQAAIALTKREERS